MLENLPIFTTYPLVDFVVLGILQGKHQYDELEDFEVKEKVNHTIKFHQDRTQVKTAVIGIPAVTDGTPGYARIKLFSSPE